MKKIFAIVSISSLFIILYFFIQFDKVKNVDKIKVVSSGAKKYNTGNIILKPNKNSIGTGYKNKKKRVSIKDVLKGEKNFSYFVYNIKEKYNLVNIIIKEFQKVKNKEDYVRVRNKFGGDQLLYTFLKIKNIKLADKYMNYYFKLNLKIINKTKEKNMLFLFNKTLTEYYNKGYYNKLPYKTKDGKYDYFVLSLMNYSLDKKIKICKEGFKKEDDFNSCKRAVIYMAANKKNNYCKKMNKLYYKKWCSDTLEYLDNNK